jgi:hypothetical protein
MKDQLRFDTTDATSIAETDSVGAYVRSSDGTLITHSTVGGKEALDVSIADGVNVEVDLSHIDDSVRLGDGANFFTSTNENGDWALDVHISNSNIEVTQGTSPWVIGDGGSSITVDAVDLDIRDLTHVSDSVSIGDGTEIAAVNASNELQVRDDDANTALSTIAGDTTSMDAILTALSKAEDSAHVSGDQGLMGLAVRNDTLASLVDTDGDYAPLQVDASGALYTNISNTISINDAALANATIASAANTLAVANTAEGVVASPLTDRKYLYIYNFDNKRMFVGQSGVTAANGFPISGGSYMELRAGDNIGIEYVAATVGHEIRTLELS